MPVSVLLKIADRIACTLVSQNSLKASIGAGLATAKTQKGNTECT